MAEEERCKGRMRNVYIQGDKTIKDSDLREDVETSERQPQDEACDIICEAKGTRMALKEWPSAAP